MKRILSLILSVLILFTVVSANAAVRGISNSNSVSSSGKGGFKIEPIQWDTAVVGQYALPDGYTAIRLINNCDENSTLGHPIRVSVILNNQDEDARMQYYCGEDYIDRVYSSTSLIKHVEGEIDAQTMNFMRRYVNADEFCDALAKQ